MHFGTKFAVVSTTNKHSLLWQKKISTSKKQKN